MSKRLKVILISVGGVVVIAIVLGIIFWPNITNFIQERFYPETDTPAPSNGTGDPAETKDEKLMNSALDAASKSGAAAGQAVLDQELNKTTDKMARALLYGQKSTLAQTEQGGDNYKVALQYAYLAENEIHDYGSAIQIADLEYYTGDKSKALTYYKLYLDRLTPAAIELNPGDKESIEQRVKELEAGQ